MQTEGLLKQSQQLATETADQQKELQADKRAVGPKGAAARRTKRRGGTQEPGNRASARRRWKEKPRTGSYFKITNRSSGHMSHELRTPLNSILVLGQQLAENPDGNLSGRQVEFARTIHGAGTDLLNLISDILDLSKIESGTVSVEAEEVFFNSLIEMVSRPFRHEAGQPQTGVLRSIRTRVCRAAWSPIRNACSRCSRTCCRMHSQFTEQGKVQLSVSLATGGVDTRPSDSKRKRFCNRVHRDGHGNWHSRR